MDPGELTLYLHQHIPLSQAMGVSVVAIDENAVTLRAPLAPNLNHQQTVFGGSASAVAILSGWALLHVRLHAEGSADRLVIQRNLMEYQQPIFGPFTARSTLERPDHWRQFTATLARKGRARVAVAAVLEHADQVVGRFNGQFVALAGDRGR